MVSWKPLAQPLAVALRTLVEDALVAVVPPELSQFSQLEFE